MARVRSEAEKLRILKEGRDRFRHVEAYEAEFRGRFVEDVKFGEGDSDNNWQWPEDIRKPRETDKRPMLTINKTRQHVLDVLNDARQSRVAVKIIPTGGQATYESAQAYMGVVRAIEYRSNADVAYQTGLKFAVQGGIGYWRLLADYVDDDTFDQELLIKRVKNPMMIYLDPNIEEFDGSDAGWGFVATDVPTKDLERQYPKWKGRLANSRLAPGESWVREGLTRIAEYWRRVEKRDTLVSFLNQATGETVIARLSEIPKKVREIVLADPKTKTREIRSHKVEGFKIIGDEIAEEMEWLGIYIPIIRIVGEETVIDGELDRKGHVRSLKDAQRMFNYNASAFIEHGALQTKSPWVGPAEAFEDYEGYWDTANTQNHSRLPYNHRDEQGDDIPAPTRPGPPVGSPLYLEGMNSAAEWMRMASGQYQADMGAPSNERSGKAIEQRQRQGDNATYHYLDHQAIAVRFLGKMLIDAIPKYYDTARVLKYRGDDGTENEIHLDPDQKEAVRTEQVDKDTKRTIFNPNVGKYDVEADVGPSFATKRQDAFNAGTQILAQNKELTAVIGDLVLQFADFPGADEMAQRLKRMVPPQALDDQNNPEVTALQGQIKQAQDFITELAKKLADKDGEARQKQEETAVKGYSAITARIAAVKEALGMDAQMLLALVREVMEEGISTSGHGGPLALPLDVPEEEDIPSGVPQGMGGPPATPPVDPNAQAPGPA